MMKKVGLILFLVFCFFIVLSCNQEPKVKSKEIRDENGHLKQVDYYNKDDTLYKTEYYEYLNKHDEDSRLVKIVIKGNFSDELEQYDRTFDTESNTTIYKMQDCWKQAYIFQKNIYKLNHCEVAALYPKYRVIFGEIQGDTMPVKARVNSSVEEVYDIKTRRTISELISFYEYSDSLVFVYNFDAEYFEVYDIYGNKDEKENLMTYYLTEE